MGGALILGFNLGILVMAAVAAGAAADRAECSWQLAAGSRQQDEHEVGPGR